LWVVAPHWPLRPPSAALYIASPRDRVRAKPGVSLATARGNHHSPIGDSVHMSQAGSARPRLTGDLIKSQGLRNRTIPDGADDTTKNLWGIKQWESECLCREHADILAVPLCGTDRASVYDGSPKYFLP